MSRTLAVVVTFSFLIVACGDDDGENGSGADSHSAGAGAGAGGASAGSGGTPASGTAGSSAGFDSVTGGSSAAGSNAAGGAGGQLSGEPLKQATYTECERNCELVKTACPASNLAQCVSTCHDQADNAASTGKCGQELYDVLKCINTTQMKTDITCGASGPDYTGCKANFVAYYACAGA